MSALLKKLQSKPTTAMKEPAAVEKTKRGEEDLETGESHRNPIKPKNGRLLGHIKVRKETSAGTVQSYWRKGVKS